MAEQSGRPATYVVGDEYRIALEANIRAFESQSVSWAENLAGQFALFHDAKLIHVFASFDDAARTAIKEFGRECYLIREIGLSVTEAETAHHITSVW
jgi:hypothetical protein